MTPAARRSPWRGVALVAALAGCGAAGTSVDAGTDAPLATEVPAGDVPAPRDAVIKPNGVVLEPRTAPRAPRERWLRACVEDAGRCDLPAGTYVPVEDGPRELVWTPADGRYLNEPTLLRDRAGRWHVVSNGTTGVGDPWAERSLLHGAAPSLRGPWTLLPDAISGEGLDGLWGAHLLADPDGYLLIHFAHLAGQNRGENRVARSADLGAWRVDAAPLPGSRDAMLLRLPDGREVLYATAILPRDGRTYDAVTAHVRAPGGAWEERVALEQTFPCRAACWGFYESPYVVALGGLYYLFATYTDSGYATYEQTVVFRSADPLRFPQPPVAVLTGHGAEVHVEGGRFYLTSGGWPSRIGAARRGLTVVPLAWAPEG